LSVWQQQLPANTGPCLRLFFFQAEDGIRGRNVTGVQTCALPILNATWISCDEIKEKEMNTESKQSFYNYIIGAPFDDEKMKVMRSEERRVGKSVDKGGGSVIRKKKREMEGEQEQRKVIRTKCGKQ